MGALLKQNTEAFRCIVCSLPMQEEEEEEGEEDKYFIVRLNITFESRLTIESTAKDFLSSNILTASRH